MEIIQAQVSQNLLKKASRLFTGTLSGRIIELLQNARRAGATRVEIDNKDGVVTVRDNGCGIKDFKALLTLGASDWTPSLDQTEDPAGVGVFSLAPRDVVIESYCKRVELTEESWSGASVSVGSSEVSTGTVFTFKDDEPWTESLVAPWARFIGFDVVVDGVTQERLEFSSAAAVEYPELGCTVEILNNGVAAEQNRWYAATRGLTGYTSYVHNLLVNFYGQLVCLYVDILPTDQRCLVNMTGKPTGIRLMLPARTRLVENKAFRQLIAAVEESSFRRYFNDGAHSLPYDKFLRAHALGVQLPEAVPQFLLGTLHDNGADPVEVIKPNDVPLSACYRLGHYDECAAANVHLLSALGKFDSPFVVVNIHSRYNGYSWTKLPTVDSVRVAYTNVRISSWLSDYPAKIVDGITITAVTSDGKTFEHAMPACLDAENDDKSWEYTLFLTADALEHLHYTNVWNLVGGPNEDSGADSYDTQYADFETSLDEFFERLCDPKQVLREKLMRLLRVTFDDNKLVSMSDDGVMTLVAKDGKETVVKGVNRGTDSGL